MFRHLLFCVGLLVTVAAAAADHPPSAAIASAHPLATGAGVQILNEGGNAFDAAVTVAAVLAVVEPYNSGLGGGGFFLLHRAQDNRDVVIDARETAPLAATPDMYLDGRGRVIAGRSMNGPLAAAIPGLPAALEHLAAQYGRLPLARDLEPAIRLAREGFAIGETYRRLAKFRLEVLRASPEAAAAFLAGDEVPEAGHRIVQPVLADTLALIAAGGAGAFYEGRLARKLVDGVRAAGGLWSEEDLKNYRVIEREPITGRYRDIRVVSAPPPSSGGIVLLEALNILEGYDFKGLDDTTVRHLTVEAMRRAYRDRAEFLGDPAFVDMPVQALTGKSHAAQQRASIDPARATPSTSLSEPALKAEGRNTTHFSILDRDGNRVAATLSINYPFGSGFMPPGTGMLLNDEMDDFSAQPGAPNAYGLVGGSANAIAPGKRPLSSMTPAFLETEDRIGILGTPGGSRIVSQVLLGVLDFAKGNPPDSWVRVRRFHHQYLPDVIEFEPGALTEIEQAGLRRRGHGLKQVDRAYGNMQAILWDRKHNTVRAASDPRGEGAATPTAAASDDHPGEPPRREQQDHHAHRAQHRRVDP